MRYFVLTNNPMVRDFPPSGPAARCAEVVFKECGIGEIFDEAALCISRGHVLLTHPLSGSVKPGETPYKSMLLSAQAAESMDQASAQLIARAVDACGKFEDKTDAYDPGVLEDLQVVDRELISSAIRSAG